MTGGEPSPALYADLVLAGHAAFVLFVVAGQALILAGMARGWCWTRNRPLRLLHLAAIALVVAESWLGLTCPLTSLEDRLRAGTGAAPRPEGFIAHWLHRLLFYEAPEWLFVLLYTAFGLIVALTYVLHPPRPGSSRRSRPAGIH